MKIHSITAAEALAAFESNQPERDAEMKKMHRKLAASLSVRCWEAIRDSMDHHTSCRIDIGRKTRYYWCYSAVKEVVQMLNERGFETKSIDEHLEISWKKEDERRNK